MSVEVRTAVSGDKARCLELLTMLDAAHSNPQAGAVFDNLLDTKRGAVFVAQEDRTLLGMASVSYNLAMRYGGEYCALEELIVDPAARGKQAGKLLVQHAIDAARARGCAAYGLYLIPTTEHNRGFYESLGFEVLGTQLGQALRPVDSNS